MPRTTFPLRARLDVGDLVAVFDSAASREDALAWIDGPAPQRVRWNRDILRISTHRFDAFRTITTVRIGLPL